MTGRSLSTCRLTRCDRSNLLEITSSLCISLIGVSPTLQIRRCRRQSLLPVEYRFLSSETPIQIPPRGSPDFERWALSKLPRQCPGCGAPSQTINSLGPGYYDLKRHAVLKYLGIAKSTKRKENHEIVRLALQKAASLNLDPAAFGVSSSPPPNQSPEVVKCFRCRNLLNHRLGTPINHPSIESIRETIHETPYKYNHVYHVIDAADFPMSVIPDLQESLKLSPLRSKNRRSKSGKFYGDKKIEMSYIITRSDLLAPLKEQVDSLMPYLRATLKDALGRLGVGMRLGNISCVSVKRDWWIKELKEDVWNRGDGGWMVGKVNVGKSKLFGSIFPKGRTNPITESNQKDQKIPSVSLPYNSNVDQIDQSGDTNSQMINSSGSNDFEQTTEIYEAQNMTEESTVNIDSDSQCGAKNDILKTNEFDEEPFDTESFLPPAPAEVNYPTMPIASDLPGTTASPIRLLFGNGKGELIDLPGLYRGNLENYVLPAYRPQLVMQTRIEPVQNVIKPIQSLLLGGIIRITPTAPDVVILAYAFTPIEPHVTNTEKAIAIQTHSISTSVLNIGIPGIKPKIMSAGKFHLMWDVTKKRTGPVTSHDAGRVHVDQLPYRVLATDILIEGCGWVELVAQVSKRHGESIIKPLSLDSEESQILQEVENKETGEIWPGVEVFSPDGKFISARRPMNAWSFISKRQSKVKARPKRPIVQPRKK